MVDLTNDDIMLELAAKAAGYLNWTHCDCGLFIETDSVGFYWNPLANDGDALRLAVKLDIGLQFNRPEDEQTVQALWPDPDNLYSCGTFTEPMTPDKAANTRRAIVRAAAEIGRNILREKL